MESFDVFFDILEKIDNFFWSYVGFSIICVSGIYLTIISRGKQFKVLCNIRKTVRELKEESSDDSSEDPSRGLHPFKLFFASVGGMIGIGNIVGVGIAVMLGGPGSVFWMWVASLSGMLIKYSEIYLGVKHRVKNNKGSYNGGPMYYLQDAFKTKFWSKLSAILLCIYGVEVFQFLTLVDRFETTFELNRNFVIFVLLGITLYSTSGGIGRLANICSMIMPLFMLIYISACLFIILTNYHVVIPTLKEIIISAFSGSAAIGGFVGSTMVYGAYLGSSKAVYSGDIGIGYDAVVQSETKIACPIKQARLSIIALFADTIICTFTSFTICITGAWYRLNDLEASQIMASILGEYFPFSEYFLTIVLFFAGFTTVIAFFVVGQKAASFLMPKWGKNVYLVIGSISFVFFSHFSEEKVALIMSITSLMLLLLNIIAIMKMRKEIKFYEDETS